jgi:RNA polymerase sigma-70 factor (ECF subfamily)
MDTKAEGPQTLDTGEAKGGALAGPGAGPGGGPGVNPGAGAGFPPGPVTRETLERVRKRDPQALATFFEFYFDRVYGLACRLLGDHTSAEDVTQEVFQKVHRAAEQLDPGRDPGPWLMAITHNACRDTWRSRAYKLARKSRSLEDTEGLAESLPSPGETPEEATIRVELARKVQEAILDLPEELRAVVVLHDYQGLGHEEIAMMIGSTHVATRKRYSRALTRLAQALKGVV